LQQIGVGYCHSSWLNYTSTEVETHAFKGTSCSVKSVQTIVAVGIMNSESRIISKLRAHPTEWLSKHLLAPSRKDW